MKTNIYHRIQSFWDNQPCGTTHLNLPAGSKEYFVAFDQYFEKFYPYFFPFLKLESLRDKKVLEIGLGSGSSLGRIAQVANMAIGLDISFRTLELNQARQNHLCQPFHLTQASAVSMPFRDNAFDAVVSIGCLHHIPEIQAAIDEIYRVLKPGGIFQGMVYYKNSFRFRVYIPRMRRSCASWQGKSWQECVNEMYDSSGNPYGMVYSKKDIVRLFNKFKVQHFEIQNFVGQEVHYKIGEIIPRNVWLKTLGRIMGLDLYFVACAQK